MIDIYDIIRPGDRVDIQNVTVDDSAEEKKFYITKVFDVTEDGDVEIVMPMEKTKMIVLSIGAVYELFFYAGKGLYACKAEVTSRRNENGVAIAVLEPSTELEKHQRREYYRYDCVIGMTSRMLGSDEEAMFEQEGKLDPFQEPSDKGVIVDLSGGGMRFVSASDYPEGSLVHCRFMLDRRGKMQLYDEVVRILFVEHMANHPVNKEFRAQFLHMELGEREDIIRFIFEEERKMRARKNGL